MCLGGDGLTINMLVRTDQVGFRRKRPNAISKAVLTSDRVFVKRNAAVFEVLK